MRVRLSELEKEQAFMKQGMRDGKPIEHGKAFFSSLSRGIGRIGIFGPGAAKQHKSSMRKSQEVAGFGCKE